MAREIILFYIFLNFWYEVYFIDQMLERVAGRAGGDNAVLCSSVQFSWHKFINPALSPAAHCL